MKKTDNTTIWNRCATAYNTLKDEGMAEFHKYMSNFTQEEIEEILALFKRIEKEGYSRVRDSIVKH